MTFFFQNAGEGPTEHVQNGAAVDRLYGVSVGTADQCNVSQKPRWYDTFCSRVPVTPKAKYNAGVPVEHRHFTHRQQDAHYFSGRVARYNLSPLLLADEQLPWRM